MKILGIDHLALTVSHIGRTCDFYVRCLGMEEETFADGRKALRFGDQKLNLHQQGKEFQPRAQRPTPGSADLCFVSATSLEALAAHLKTCGIIVEEGPVLRTGAKGPIRSIYIRDPDQNLIELSNYVEDA